MTIKLPKRVIYQLDMEIERKQKRIDELQKELADLKKQRAQIEPFERQKKKKIDFKTALDWLDSNATDG